MGEVKIMVTREQMQMKPIQQMKEAPAALAEEANVKKESANPLNDERSVLHHCTRAPL